MRRRADQIVAHDYVLQKSVVERMAQKILQYYVRDKCSGGIFALMCQCRLNLVDLHTYRLCQYSLDVLYYLKR